MKQILLALLVLVIPTKLLCAQDAATEERLNKLNGIVQDLLEDKANLRKQMDALAKEVQSLREANAASSGHASAEDLRRLAEKIQEVDRKRMEDNERILSVLDELKKSVSTPRPKTPAGSGAGGAGADKPERTKGYEYVIQSGDTLSVVVQAYRDQGIKVSVDEILKANPGLKANSLKVGQKIFIPAPSK